MNLPKLPQLRHVQQQLLCYCLHCQDGEWSLPWQLHHCVKEGLVPYLEATALCWGY